MTATISLATCTKEQDRNLANAIFGCEMLGSCPLQRSLPVGLREETETLCARSAPVVAEIHVIKQSASPAIIWQAHTAPGIVCKEREHDAASLIRAGSRPGSTAAFSLGPKPASRGQEASAAGSEAGRGAQVQCRLTASIWNKSCANVYQLHFV